VRIELPRPDDWHVHLRQGEALTAYARRHGSAFGRILAMPNTRPPLTDPDGLTAYRRRAEEAAPSLTVLPAFRIMPTMTGEAVRALAAAGAPAGKYYPDGATTNSEGGLSDWRRAEDALAAMEEAGTVLCVHGEKPDAPVLEREEAFLPAFMEIRWAFPKLRMILEHVSSAAGVQAVMDASDRGPTGATVTLQHLLFTLDDLVGGLLNPHLFCKPLVKGDADREAIRERVLDGDSRFFFGSDSAPHPKGAKESGACPAGCYTAPLLLPALAAWFEEQAALDRLEAFLCDFGRLFYGMDSNSGTVLLEKTPWRVPDEADGCVPLMAGRELSWRVVES